MSREHSRRVSWRRRWGLPNRITSRVLSALLAQESATADFVLGVMILGRQSLSAALFAAAAAMAKSG